MSSVRGSIRSRTARDFARGFAAVVKLSDQHLCRIVVPGGVRRWTGAIARDRFRPPAGCRSSSRCSPCSAFCGRASAGRRFPAWCLRANAGDPTVNVPVRPLAARCLGALFAAGTCTVLLILSYWVMFLAGSALYPFQPKQPGVPLKDYIVQSGLFTICALRCSNSRPDFGGGVVWRSDCCCWRWLSWSTSRWWRPTAILVIAVLLMPFALRRSLEDWCGGVGGGVVLAAIAWVASPYLRNASSADHGSARLPDHERHDVVVSDSAVEQLH